MNETAPPNPEPSVPPHPAAPPHPVAPPKPGAPPAAVPPTAAPPGGRRRAWRFGAAAAVLVLVGACAVALAGREGRGPVHGSMPAPVVGPVDGPVVGDGAQALPGSPHALLLDGVSGRVEIVGSRDSAATAAYLPEGSEALGRVGFGPAGSDGAVPVRCAAADGGPLARCGGVLRLTVPEDTALTVRQESGEIALSGLRGDLALSLASIRCTAVGLRPEHATVSVRSGSADLGFAAPPGDLTLESTSASVALRLPADHPDDGYAFESDAASADVRIALPEQPGADHRVRLRTTSASVAVLPAEAG
ncbi:hypothetical protein [Kitasatospora sp. NPDC088783]|uniref:hypothetical protein n=1 Tax=Kitasatospora sp. NPDC088783 TaxID=3364077 RepID=UPI003812131C